MKYASILVLFIFCLNFGAFSQKFTISGIVTDKNTGEKLIGANIYVNNGNTTFTGTTTNNFGFYSLTLTANDSIELCGSFLGYSKQKLKLQIITDTIINFCFTPIESKIDEIIITAGANNGIENKTQMGVLEIPMKQFKLLPNISGEIDVLRAFQLMPGVQSGQEGTSSLFVRGGSPDQNLVLLDDVPLYYINHIGGFLSVFDINAINDIKLHKGGFPANYGGRLSSVIDIRMKEGNKTERNGEFSLGTLSAKIFLEGPIKKDTSSYMFSFRRCNFDVLTSIAALLDSDGDVIGGYTFYDLNAKYSKKINYKNKINFTVYSGNDRLYANAWLNGDDYSEVNFKSKYKDNLKWGNKIFAGKWEHLFSQKLFGHFTLAYDMFRYLKSLKTDYKSDSLSYKSESVFGSGIKDFVMKADFEYYASQQHKINYGGCVFLHFFRPGFSSAKESGKDISNSNSEISATRIFSTEPYIYFSDEFLLGKKIKVNAGFHSSSYIYSTKSFFSFQPRLNMNYLLNSNSSVKISYSAMKQYLHLLTGSGIGIPTDLWIPATKIAKPEFSYLFSAGFSHTMQKAGIEVSIESYLKQMNNLVEYKNGASFSEIDKNWEEKIETNGMGKVFGIELLIQKRAGNTTGWLGYTLSKNIRKFENLNNGKYYPYAYDRTHDFSIVCTHTFNSKVSLSGSWVYSTGRAISLAVSKHEIIDNSSDKTEYLEAHIYGERNNYRMPPFHKLDIGVNFTKKGNKGIRTWYLGVYNAYNHLNANYLYYKEDNQGIIKLYKFCLFPIIPSFNYSLKF